MSKITRRFFLGSAGIGALLFASPLSWVEARTRAQRATVAGWWRRLNRWGHGMEPRWIDMTSTQHVRSADDPNAQGREPGFAYTTSWRELRWPDNDELVEKTPGEVTVSELPPRDPAKARNSEGLYALPVVPPRDFTEEELEMIAPALAATLRQIEHEQHERKKRLHGLVRFEYVPGEGVVVVADDGEKS